MSNRRRVGFSLPVSSRKHQDRDEFGRLKPTLRNCAGCHQRFDSIGLAFESFGPIGERRSLDLGGHPVQTQAMFPDGTSGNGLEDLQRYLIGHRRDDFVENVVRRMFVYALGRGLLLSDTRAIESAKSRLAEDDYRLGTLVETIVTSPQFLNKRVR